MQELLRRKAFGEHISNISSGRHEWDNDLMLLYTVAYKEMSAMNMLGAFVVLRIVSKVDGSRIVDEKPRRSVVAVSKFLHKATQVHGFFSGLGGGHDLCLARGESHRLLLLT